MLKLKKNTDYVKLIHGMSYSRFTSHHFNI